MIHLLWAVHNHQPVGNFDFIFARAYDQAYRPFLDVLRVHPGIRLSLHYSGILLDWLEQNHPEYLRAVRELCAAGQVEILGGGYYEPILPMLTDGDKEGQIAKLSARVEQLFGSAPRGMWLAERVWEPSLAAPIARCGIEYVVLDGSHFKMVGKTDADLDGYFETEDQGHALKLFPIHDVIRDTIPFHSVEEVIASLRARNTEPRVQIVFGDDGEKFGDWPQTFATVYTHGWLDRFFSAIEAEPETFALLPLRSGLESARSLGLVYLPPASYQEMMVWAQDPVTFRVSAPCGIGWKSLAGAKMPSVFCAAPFWRNFLAKYPESNRMHKQGLRLTRFLDQTALAEPTGASAARDLQSATRDHLWQAQCNCAYWHGVFGGLYLPHLRFAVYRHLIAAQKLIDPLQLGGAPHAWEESDWNFDGRKEFLLHTGGHLLAFTADGGVDQWWLKRTGINLCDTLTRRREAYHAFVASGPEGGTKLENQIGSKEAGLAGYLIYDRRLRTAFSEWILPSTVDFEAYRRQDFAPLAECVFGPAVLLPEAAAFTVRFEGQADFSPGGALLLRKTYALARDGGSLSVTWNIRCRGGDVRFRFVAETLFCLLAGNAPDRYVSWRSAGSEQRDILASRAEMPGVTKVELTDEWLRLCCSVEAPEAAAFWRDAIETVSQSEGGYERVYQGTVVAPVWEMVLSEGAEVEARLRVALREEMGDGQQGA